MEIESAGAGSTVAAAMALKRSTLSGEVGVSLLRKQLDFEQELASQLLSAMGIGGNIDLTA